MGAIYRGNINYSGGGGSSTLSQDLTASVTVGGVTAGKKFNKGDELETVVRNILSPTLYPTLTNPSARTWYGQVVPLFGNGNIDPKGLQSGDVIIIRYYITNGVLESGDLEDSLESINPNNTETYNDHSDTYSGGWSPPFVFKVIYNGQRRVSW